MKKVRATQEIEIFLAEDQIKHIAMDFLKEKLQWHDKYSIEDGWVMKMQTYHGSHSWSDKIKIREASEIDHATNAVFTKIKNNL